MDVDEQASKYSFLYKSRIGVSRSQKGEQKQIENYRREKRQTIVNANRNLEDEAEDVMENILPPTPSKTDLRKERLIKWKKNQENAFMKNKKNLKKPFVVGIVRHKINSPLPVFSNLKKQVAVRSMRNVAKPLVTTMEKRETRAEVKKKTVLKPLSQNLAVFPFTGSTTKASSVFKLKPLHASSSKMLTKPITPLFMRREAAKKVQMKQYFFPQRNNKEGKQSSSDEELAVPLSPPLRVTRSRQLLKRDVKHIQIMKPRQEKLPEKKMAEPPLRKCGHVKKVVIEEETTSGSSKVQNGPTMSSNFVLSPLVFVGKGKISAQHSSMLKPSPKQKIGLQARSTFQNEPVKAVNTEEEDNSVSTEDQNGPTTPPNDFVLNSSVIVGRGKRSARCRSMLKPSPEHKVSLQHDPIQDEPVNDPTFQNGPVKDVNIEEKNPSASMEIQNGTTMSHNDLVLNASVIVGREKRSARSRNMLKPSPQQKIDLQDVPIHDEAVDSPTFHKTRLNNETARLLLLAEDWEKIIRLENLNQYVIDDIDLVVGQTRLLTRDKFQQFRTLIEQHEANHEKIKVTLDDLNGFWDMMYLQVENLNKKYEKLAILKSNNWVEPELSVKQKGRRPRVKKTAIGAKSIIGEKTPMKQTSLIKQDLTSEAKKRRSSVHDSAAAAVVRLSLTAKDFGRLPLIMVNDMSTTPKSCLKMKHVENSEMKSIRRTVLFDQIVGFEDEENQNKESTKNKRRRNNSEIGCFCTPQRSTRLSVKNSIPSTG